MKKNKNIFLGKKILIYGLGKSGVSTFKFLRNKANIYLFDDNLKKNQKFISLNKIPKKNFDAIIVSPGIDILNCKLSRFLKKNFDKIYTDLDIFYSYFDNESISITGTNGKSTTAKILHNVLLDQKKDVRLVGNIGNPLLSEKKINKKTIFVIEASSYQLDYSKIFSSKYAMILNISVDHIERHRNLKNYVNAKFKLLDSQTKNCVAFVKKNDDLIKKKLNSKNFKSKIIKVDTKKSNSFFKDIKNEYFLTETNKENLSFIFEISKKLKLKNNLLLKTINKFKGLKYRQQIILKKKNLIVINDSKSTSFASSIGILKNNQNIYWIIGGIHKKGDKLNLPKKYFKKIKAFVFGKDKKFFNNELKGKIVYENFTNLEFAFKKIIKLIKKDRSPERTILFSPSAASFDSFKNFEERGLYFNKLSKKYLNGI